MTAVDSTGGRIVTLDVVRGVAVMGILAMNIVAFAMPFQAYMNPAVYGSEGAADYASWAFNFILVDGKMRGLFSFLFGASMLLVIERAAASGHSPASIHFRRMFWLLIFGLIHFYFIWFGDILAGYAQIGMIAYLFHRLSPKALVRWGIGLVVVQTLLFSAMAFGTFYLQAAAAQPNPPAEVVQQWQGLQSQMGALSGQALSTKLGMFLGTYGPIALHRLEGWHEPFASILFFGWETLAYFLFGMALLKTGFFRGEWEPARYRRLAMIGFGIGLPVYAGLAFLLYRDGFSLPMVLACAMAATVPFRPLMVIAIASLIILAARRGGALVDRIAAAGRAAFTNYLGSSILMTTLFYGYGIGLYGSMSRVELWVVVIAMWALMLLWSKPWLDRFNYGPLEWLWRSLARGRVETLARAPAPA
ncbi:MAG TPA: DUF418 domain-containing protein [Allosphingosinicella sp.]|jgi:uncharacterized protein